MSDDPEVTKLLDEDPVYTTDLGAAYQGESQHLLGQLPNNSVDLIVTSPPFALQHQKGYGNESLEDYNDWFMENFAEQVQRVLQPHGSFVVEIGGAFERGKPERSTYQFELLNRLTDPSDEGFKDAPDSFHLAQDFYWFNPAKLPNPIEWVNVRKFRVTDAVTHIWWLAKEINKDPALTDDLKTKLQLIERVVETDLEIETKSNIAKAILRGDAPATEDGDGIYTEQLQTYVNEEFPQIAAEIRNIIETSNKAPSVFARQVIAAVENGESIPYPEPKPEANNQRVLQEYSDSQKELIETGEYNDGERPSGWQIGADSFANDNDGSIAKNYQEAPEADRGSQAIHSKIEAANTASLTKYQELCRKLGRDKHPARFTPDIPHFFINFLTPDPETADWDRGHLDRPLVLDIFAGSNLTGKVAQDEGRYWLAFEKDQDYIENSELRFLEPEEAMDKFEEHVELNDEDDTKSTTDNKEGDEENQQSLETYNGEN